ncbi:MAG: flavodoxin family protein [Candidatus Heimdallarchaeota archaeon]
MKVLGLIGSWRKAGNTECLVKEALLGAKQAGASELELIRLTDLSLKSCKGCMACVIKGEACRIEDDFEFLVEKILEADGIIVGAPTYIYSSTAIIKLILDRILQVALRLEAGLFDNKVGASIAVAGRRDWAPMTLPTLNLFVLSWGLKLVDAMLADSPGPGEVLLNEAFVIRANQIGSNIVEALRRNENEREFHVDGEQGFCPACHSDLIRISEKGITCAICGLNGKFTPGNVSITFDSVERSRFARDEFSEHLHGWIIASGSRYMKNRAKIEPLRAKYRALQF